MANHTGQHCTEELLAMYSLLLEPVTKPFCVLENILQLLRQMSI